MNQNRRGRLKGEQGSLFHPPRQTPPWSTLPLELRTEVTKLVARMLSAHRLRHAVPKEEVPGE
jgi:hypothetical protein